MLQSIHKTSYYSYANGDAIKKLLQEYSATFRRLTLEGGELQPIPKERYAVFKEASINYEILMEVKSIKITEHMEALKCDIQDLKEENIPLTNQIGDHRKKEESLAKKIVSEKVAEEAKLNFGSPLFLSPGRPLGNRRLSQPPHVIE